MKYENSPFRGRNWGNKSRWKGSRLKLKQPASHLSFWNITLLLFPGRQSTGPGQPTLIMNQHNERSPTVPSWNQSPGSEAARASCRTRHVPAERWEAWGSPLPWGTWICGSGRPWAALGPALVTLQTCPELQGNDKALQVTAHQMSLKLMDAPSHLTAKNIPASLRQTSANTALLCSSRPSWTLG